VHTRQPEHKEPWPARAPQHQPDANHLQQNRDAMTKEISGVIDFSGSSMGLACAVTPEKITAAKIPSGRK